MTENDAVLKLKTHGIQVHQGQKRIVIPKDKHVGLKLWSAIDYLQSLSYLWIRSTKNARKRKNKRSKK